MYLTEEQKEIINFVKKGFTNIEIGEELGYSSDTIKKKLRSIYKKFNVKRRIDLVSKIVRYSL